MLKDGIGLGGMRLLGSVMKKRKRENRKMEEGKKEGKRGHTTLTRTVVHTNWIKCAQVRVC